MLEHWKELFYGVITYEFTRILTHLSEYYYISPSPWGREKGGEQSTCVYVCIRRQDTLNCWGRNFVEFHFDMKNENNFAFLQFNFTTSTSFDTLYHFQD